VDGVKPHLESVLGDDHASVALCRSVDQRISWLRDEIRLGDIVVAQYLLGGGSATFIVLVITQVRLHVRDSADRKLARHMFDHMRSTDALDGYTRLVRARHEWRPQRARPTPPSIEDIRSPSGPEL
jgi:hypothetical protein